VVPHGKSKPKWTFYHGEKWVRKKSDMLYGVEKQAFSMYDGFNFIFLVFETMGLWSRMGIFALWVTSPAEKMRTRNGFE
jgi:hypothetical protein